MNEPIDDRRLDELDLSVRTHNCLRRAGISTAAQLVRTPEVELQKIGGIGGIYWSGFLNEMEKNGLKIESK